MNTTLAPVRAPVRDEHRVAARLASLPSRLGLIDRVSLRVGLWLLLRTTRGVHPASAHDAHAQHLALATARERREHLAQRERLLSAPRA